MTVAAQAPTSLTAAGAQLARLRTLWRNLPLKAKLGAVILAIYVLIAILGPTLAPFDPNATDPNATGGSGPSLRHLFGTANDGGDVFSQVLVGIRSTVLLGLLTASFATIALGPRRRHRRLPGGSADEALMLMTNVFLVLPALPLLIVLLGYLPNAGEVPTAIVLSVLGWPWGARVIRAQTLALRRPRLRRGGTRDR